MSYVELKILFFAQIGIDIIILFVVLLLIRKVRYFYKSRLADNCTNRLKAALTEADALAKQFEKQLAEKRELIESVNRQLGERTMSLNLLLNRADMLLSAEKNESMDGHKNGGSAIRMRKIMEMAKKGHEVEEIANVLSLSKEEVRLVLDLCKKGIAAEAKKGDS